MYYVAVMAGDETLPFPQKNSQTWTYATLESVLELNTLKIKSTLGSMSSLQIFVEHPPASGNFVKIQPWKDDGTLQSTLMKAFFEERMKNDTTTTLDIRDGNVQWFKARGLMRTKSTSSTGGESEEHEGETRADAKATCAPVAAKL
ncbi:hypothetical protein BT96DRAFT_975154 [Gymnopus androsaceus JB14]|uniref:Uncharacterized protein n=1 Tax=Gymnopus androsaceus JB14 TaxID=1447944 RepID=A0A6A4HSW4_9AGAR|nr:hypothetical protein BT96DRAFT_975154 [Gymnopus androsaceus JB14]